MASEINKLYINNAGFHIISYTNQLVIFPDIESCAAGVVSFSIKRMMENRSRGGC